MKSGDLSGSRDSLAAKLRNPTLGVYLLALGIILTVTAYCGQLHSPYLEHDDWNFLLPASWGKGYATPWQKTLTEGRWLNYWWYLLIGARWSATAAAWAYALLVALFAGVLSFRLEGHARKLLLTLVIFFSPMFAELSIWPAALAASRLLLALSALAFAFAGRRGRMVALGLATFLAVMSYAGAAPVILLAYVFMRRVERQSELAITLAIYLAAYALSILCIATLNYAYHDHFGVLIEGWRRPHPAHDPAGFWANCLIQLDHLRQTSAFLRWPLLVSAISALLVLRYGQRRLWESIMLVAIMAFAMDLGVAALGGVWVPVRSMGWLWVTMALTVILASDVRRQWATRLGYLGVVALLLAGLLHWGAVYRTRRATGNYIDAVGTALAHEAAGREVVLVGDVRKVRPLRYLYADPHTQLRMAWFGSYGVRSRSCSGAQCGELISFAREHRIRQLIFPYHDLLVVYFRRGAVFP